MITAARPQVLIARAVFPEVVDKLRQHFEVEANAADDIWPREELIRRLQGKQGVFTTGSERIDAELLAACPGLKICANMAVGYNNFDVPAMTAAGVLATNAPGVLTETTADMGFALLMAAARRVAEGEHYLRAHKWDRWAYDMLIGQDVHGSTLGIIGMGRIGQARGQLLRGPDHVVGVGFDVEMLPQTVHDVGKDRAGDQDAGLAHTYESPVNGTTQKSSPRTAAPGCRTTTACSRRSWASSRPGLRRWPSP